MQSSLRVVWRSHSHRRFRTVLAVGTVVLCVVFGGLRGRPRRAVDRLPDTALCFLRVCPQFTRRRDRSRAASADSATDSRPSHPRPASPASRGNSTPIRAQHGMGDQRPEGKHVDGRRTPARPVTRPATRLKRSSTTAATTANWGRTYAWRARNAATAQITLSYTNAPHASPLIAATYHQKGLSMTLHVASNSSRHRAIRHHRTSTRFRPPSDA